jgi:2'-5' RNA ligase
MIRAFVALPLPEPARQKLNLLQYLLPLPRRIPPENLHLTLVFLGELPGPELDEVHHALERLRAPGFPLQLRGVGAFGAPVPRSVHAGVAPSPPLEHLQRKVETAVRRAGVVLERRRFAPHVTLCRLDPRRPGTEADRARLGAAIAGNADFVAGPFAIEAFALYRSHLGGSGAHYEELARYPLSAGE